MNNSKGMTLIELMVGMVVMVIIGGVIIQFLLSAVEMFREKQLANEQIIIMDHIKMMVEEQVRYIEYMELSNGAPSGTDFHSLACVDNHLIYDGTEQITQDSIIGTHTMEVEFNRMADAVLQVTVHLDIGEPYERTESFAVRLLNMELYNNVIFEESGTVITQIYYKDEL